MAYVISSGITIEGIILINDSMIILDGGVVNSTTANTDGYIYISSGGIANSTTLSSNAFLYVSSGGVANSTAVNENCYLYVSSGGIANSTTLSSNAFLYVFSGGVVNNTTVNENCNFYVSSGGKVNSTTINEGGILFVYRNGQADSTAVNAGGQFYLSSGGIANDVTVNGNLYVFSGAVANGVTANENSFLYLSSGGIMNSAAINEGGTFFIYRNGQVNSTTINEGGILSVYIGGRADGTVVKSGGLISITSGGSATNVAAAEGARMNVMVSQDTVFTGTSAGAAFEIGNGIASGFHIASGSMSLIPGTTAKDTTINTDGVFIVRSNCFASKVQVNANGELRIFTGALVTDIVENGGYVSSPISAMIQFVPNVFSGLTLDSASATVHSGTTANSITIGSDAIFRVYSSGYLDNATVNIGGMLYVSSGGTASEIVENGGYVSSPSNASVRFTPNVFSGLTFENVLATVHSGTTANKVTVDAGAILYVYSGGSANDAAVNAGGQLLVSSGGTASDIVENGGYVSLEDGAQAVFKANVVSGLALDNASATVHSGTTANKVTVDAGAILYVYSGGSANDAAVNAGGLLLVSSGGAVSDIVENGGYVSLEDGAQAVFKANVISGLVLDNASATVHSGTTLTGATANPGALLQVHSGGSASDIVENGGYVSLEDGAQAVFKANVISGLVLDNASATVHSGTTVDAGTINFNGKLVVSGGIANNVTVTSGGRLEVHSGGMATSIVASNGGQLDFTVTPDVYLAGTSNGLSFEIKDGLVSSYSVYQGALTMCSGTVADTITVSADGLLHISGGAATNTLVDYGGTLLLADGTVTSTTVNTSGSLMLTGGTLSNTTVDSFGRFTLVDGIADNITIKTGGHLFISGGTATNVIADEGAYLHFTVTSDTNVAITSAGSAFEIRDGFVSGGFIDLNSMGVASGAVITGATVREAGYLEVSGGTAEGILVSDNGGVCVSAGSAANTTVNDQGFFEVVSEGAATGIVINGNGIFQISGGTADGITFMDGGSLYVYGGTVTNIAASENTYLSLTVSPDTFIAGTSAGTKFEIKGGSISNYTINGGDIEVSSDGFADHLTVNYGDLNVLGGGSANGIMVNGGQVRIASGGTATMIVWTPCEGHVFVSEGGVATFASQYSGVYYGSDGHLLSSAEVMNSARIIYGMELNVMSGGTVSNTTVSGGSMYISGGGTANGISLQDGYLYVSSGGTASGVMQTRGRMHLYSGGILNSAMVASTAYLTLSGGTANDTIITGSAFISGGTMNNTLLNAGNLSMGGGVVNSTTINGVMSMYSGVVNSATVNVGGSLRITGGTVNEIVENGGYVVCPNNTTLKNISFVSHTISGLYLGYRGSATVHSGTTASDTVMDSEGRITIYSGGKLTGRTICTSRSYIYVSSGGIVDFDVSRVKPDGNTALITNAYSMSIYGTPNFTITVNDNQSEGVYRLADNIRDTASKYLFTIVNTEGLLLGALSVGQAISIGGVLYSLSMDYYYNSMSSYQQYSLVLTVGDPEEYYTRDGLIISGGSRLTVYPGEKYINTTILYGSAIVSYGGMMKDTSVYSSGCIFLSSGGTAINTVLYNSRTRMEVREGSAVSTTISAGGTMLLNRGTANSTTVNPGGYMSIYAGCTATAILENGGYVDCPSNLNDSITFVSNTISGLRVLGGATLHSGTTANSVTFGGEGRLTVYSGGKLTGKIVCSNYCSIYISSGGILDYDISQMSPGGKNAIINDYYYVKESGSPVCTITVNGNQAEGVYRLADDVRSFNSSTIFTVVDTDGIMLGRLSLRQSTVISGVTYTLALDPYVQSSKNYSLVLRVGNVDSYYAQEGLVLGGSMTSYVAQKGMAIRDTYVMSRCRLVVSSGGTAADTVLYPGGSMSVYRGSASGITMNGGALYVEDGSVRGVTVNTGAFVWARYGTIADVVENGGCVDCTGLNGRITFASNTISGLNLYGTATVHSGTTANNTMIWTSAGMGVYSGGIVNKTQVLSRGSLSLFSGGTANETTVFNGGVLYISGGTATSISIADGARTSFTITTDTSIAGTSGGTAIEIKDGLVSDYFIGSGYFAIDSGVVANSITVLPGGTLEVLSGGTATGVVWTPCEGHVSISDGAHVSFASQYSGVYYGSEEQLISNAEVMDSIILGYDDQMIVMSGGTANDIIFDDYATLNVFSGGTANGTIVRNFGSMEVGSGGMVDGATVSYYGSLTVFSDGKANNTTVEQQGTFVLSGGTANNTTVNEQGTFVLSGGTANNTTVKEGTFILSDGTASNTTIKYCLAEIYSGGTADTIQAVSYGSVFVYSDAVASRATVGVGAALHVYTGGSAVDIVENGGIVEFEDGAQATFRTNVISGLLLEQGSATVHSGTTANSATVGVGAALHIYSGGSAVDIVENGGIVEFEDGAQVTFRTNVISGLLLERGSATVHSGTTADSVTAGLSGSLQVIGGTAKNVTVSGGVLNVCSGGTAIVATTLEGGTIFVDSKSVANNVVVDNQGVLHVSSGGSAVNIEISAGGNVYVSSKGVATHVAWTPGVGHIFNEGGIVTFASRYSGAYLAEGDVLSSHFVSGQVDVSLAMSQEMYVFSDCTANMTEVNQGAQLEAWDGGMLAGAVVRYGGNIRVSSGGIADNTTVSSGGSLTVFSGGTATDTVVNDYGYLIVSGGTATNITASQYARVSFTVMKNARLAGTFADSAFDIKDGLVSNYEVLSSCQLSLQSGVTADNVAIYSTGALHVSSGGKASNVIVNSYGALHVSSGGKVFDTVTNGFSASIAISSGGVVNGARVNSGGNIRVNDGGTANAAVVNLYGSLDVLSGGTANSAVVEYSGSFILSSGGMATSTTVADCGNFVIFSGGTAAGVSVSSGGHLSINGGTVTGIAAAAGANLEVIVYSDTHIAGTSAGSAFEIKTPDGIFSGYTHIGGTLTAECAAADLTVNGGMLTLDYETNGVTVNGGGSVFINGDANDIVVSSGGYLSINGGTATGIVASEGAFLAITVYSDTHIAGTSAGVAFEIKDGIASGGNIESGILLIRYLGKADGNTVNADGTIEVYSGGLADSTVVNTDGALIVSSGGIADNTTVNAGGNLFVSSGGEANRITISNGFAGVAFMGMTNEVSVLSSEGCFEVLSGGIANGNVVGDGGEIIVSRGGKANQNAVNAGGSLIVSKDGTVDDTTVNEGGSFILNSGSAYDTTVNFGGRMHISGGSAYDTNVASGGSVTLLQGTVKGINVNTGATIAITGGTAMEIVENGGYVNLRDGAQATFHSNVISGLTISNTSASVHSGTTVRGATVNGGLLDVFSGGLAMEIVENGGYVNLRDGAQATFQSSVISGLALSGTSASVHSGTTVSGAEIDANGFIEIFSGGRMTGQMVFDAESSVIVYNGAILDFNLTGATAGTSALVNNLSVIQGTPDFTITVSDTIVPGTYILAEGAAGFGQTITVRDVSGESFGPLAVGDSLITSHAVYALSLDDMAKTAALTLTVSANELPVVKDIQVSTTAPTNQSVTITAQFTDDVGLAARLYRIGEKGGWTDYVEAVTVSENTVVYFKALDISGNESEIVGCTVSNIDKVAPDKPSALADVTDFTSGDVLVTAMFSDDSAVREYSLDGTEWTDYETAIKLTGNGTVFFRGIDEAGNISEVASFEVNNIDTTAPTDPAGLQAIVSEQTVALVWSASTDDLAGVGKYIVTYSLDGQTFTATTSGTSFVLNDVACGTWDWSVQAVDAAGNESGKTAGEAFTVSESVTPGPDPQPQPVASSARNDINGNGISDVTFHWVGGDHQVGFWLDGTSQWQSQSQARSADWNVLGTYDVDANGKADLLMSGRATIVDMTGMYIGYYEDAIDTSDNWHTIGFLSSANDWSNAVGNLTGETGRNSIVWYAPDLYAVGAWIDGTDSWTSISSSFGGSDWTLIGCGDFDGVGRDSVLMSYNNGQFFYTVDIDGNAKSLGTADWRGWQLRAIGDFSGDGKDDLVLFHELTGSMVLCADGDVDSYKSIGQLAFDDWFVVGAGDYNGDRKDDLLVRQYSTGMLGYYVCADQSQWVELGRGVDMNWTVIA